MMGENTMTLTFAELAKILNDLSYLYSEHGDVLTADEAAVTKEILRIAMHSGLEHLDKEQVVFAIGLYKKYENKDLTSSEDEGVEE
jgi:hypothetical protein